jgi:hypothetical protein
LQGLMAEFDVIECFEQKGRTNGGQDDQTAIELFTLMGSIRPRYMFRI